MSGEIQQALKERISRLTPAQQAKLAQRLKSGATAAPSEPGLRRRQGLEYPITPEQSHMWLIQQVDPATHYFNHSHAFLLHGQFDMAAMQKAMDEVVRRNENLRTCFPEIEGKPQARVLSELRIPIEVEDISAVPAATRQEHILSLVNAEISRPFDLLNGPLLRANVYRVSQDEHAIIFIVHHLVTDFVSYSLLEKEVFALYSAFSRGLPSPLPEMPVQYGDFALWLDDWMKSGASERQTEYWMKRLAEVPLLDFPTDLPRPQFRSFHGERLYWRLPGPLWEQFKQLTFSANVTRFTAFLAAYAVLLCQHTGKDDIAIAVPISNRKHQETQLLIGYFLNTVVVRLDLSGNPSFNELLSRARVTMLEAMANADVPFETILNKLNIARDPSRAPLVETSFAFANDSGTINLAGLPLRVERLKAHYRSAWLDLNFAVNDIDYMAAVFFDYIPELFLHSTIERMMGHFELVLREVVADPNKRLAELNLLTAQEEHQLLVEWNQTETDIPTNCLHQFFESQAQKSPGAAAVIFAQQLLTYGELNQRSNQLAHYLQKHGVGPEMRVAVCVTRGPEMVIALMAVLKAGGAYVPLDPEYPSERLALMMKDSEAQVLLLQEQVLPQLPPFAGLVVKLDSQWAEIVRESAANPHSQVVQENLAYVIYTSGSTGKPKGTMIRHRSPAALVRWAQGVFSPEELAGVLASTSICFDLSIFEIFVPLSGGGAVIVAENALSLGEMPNREQVTLINTVPSSMRELVRGRSVPNSVRTINLAGEALPGNLVRNIYTATHVERIFNLYGPTEDTTYSTYALLDRSKTNESVPIGSPVASTHVYILNEWLRPAPLGAIGELYLAGEGLARGYLNRPDLTADRFVPNPFSVTGGERMYRTGDNARYLPDGKLEFFGRTDQQIKLRGYRVELGEIETALMSCDGVASAVVIVREDRPGEKRLTGYVVANSEVKLDPAELRDRLMKTIPSHMVPTAFVALDKLPVTATGKLDRKALPAPDFSPPLVKKPPRTYEERILCALLIEILGVPEIGLGDNFFNLGGDSILAIQLVSRMRRAGLVITTRDVFQHQTIAGLAEAVRPLTQQASSVRDTGTGTLPLTPIMHWLFERGGPIQRFSQSMLLRVPGGLGERNLIGALQAVVDHHDVLRLRLENGSDRLEIRPAGSLRAETVFHLCSIENLGEDGRNALMLQQAHAAEMRLSPENGITAQAVWFDNGTELAGRLLLIIHHLAVDAVSWQILIPDLTAAWQSLSAGLPPVLASRGTSFRQWSERLSVEANSQKRAGELEFWKSRLDHSEATLFEKPFDPSRDTLATGRHLTLTLPANITAPLLSSVPAAFGARINEVLLAALVLAVSQWRKRGGRRQGNSLLLDLEGHGREEIFNDVDLSRTVGWFTTLFPVRIELEKVNLGNLGLTGDVLEQAVKAVRAQLRAVPDAGLGYGLLRYLNPQTAPVLADLPRPEVLFNYLGRFAASEESDWTASIVLGAGANPEMSMAHGLELNAISLDRSSGPELKATWSWATAVLSEDGVNDLAREWFHALELLVAHASQQGVQGLGPSDVPLVNLSQSEIDRLEKKHGKLEDILPLSTVQEGLLFHSVYAAYNAKALDIYNVQLVLTLDGDLNEEALQSAIRTVLRRHANLRAGFEHEGTSHPVQFIPVEFSLPWRRVDLSPLPEAEQKQKLAALVHEDETGRFNLAFPPLFRFTLARTQRQQHTFAFTYHHILMDGWSSPVFMREVLTVYQRNGDASSLLRVTPYRDYLAWLNTTNRETSRAIWKEALTGLHDPTRLVAAVPGHAKEIPQEIRFNLPDALSAALVALVRQHNLTLNTLVQGAWGVLLGRLTNQEDVVFGGTVSGRPPEIPGIETMVGLFINTVPVRVQLHPGDSLIDVITRLQDQQSKLRAHEYLSLAEIQRVAGVGELFDTLVVFENYPLDRREFAQPIARMRISHAEGRDFTHYPLTLKIHHVKNVHIFLEYRTDLLDHATVEMWGKRLIQVLQQAAANPRVPLNNIEILDPAERETLLEKFNTTTYQGHIGTLPQLFEQQANLSPNASALVCRKESISYAALNARANALAYFLIGQGVGPEKVVGICMDRSIPMVVAMLAVLKAGGAYLPLDPEYPQARLAHMVTDAAPRAVLSTLHLENRMPGEIRAIYLDDLAVHAALKEHPGNNPSDVMRTEPLLPQHPAYVIYTSGSTGKPKGVVGTHKAIVDRLHWGWRALPFAPGEVCCQKTSICFIDSVPEIFAPLLRGHSLVILPEEVAKDSTRLVDALEEHHIRRIILVPFLLRHILNTEPEIGKRLACVHTVINSGEALPSDLAELFAQAMPHAALVNFYGSSEVASDASWSEINTQILSEPMPVGKPVDYAQIYILDRNLLLAPIGVVGELYVAGAGLARGYFHRSALTAERFVANPFGKPGTRMYRIGDLARWRPDGILEYMGRADQQVKIKGQRVEAGEIEAVLKEVAGVKQAIVAAHELGVGGRQLVAYLVSADETVLSPAELRSRLAERLPEYMLPSLFVSLKELPLTPNGKVDRRALPAPDQHGEIYHAPQTLEEEVLCNIFSEVLSIGRVGRRDNFFTLGGHSLIVMRVVNQVREMLSVELGVRALFEAPTPAQLASRLREGERATRTAVRRMDRPERLPLSYAQERLWFLHRLERPSATYNISLVLRLQGELNVPAMQMACQDLASRHESLRTLFPEQDGIPFQKILTAEEMPSVLTVEEIPESELKHRLAAAANVAIDVTQEIPLRGWLFQLSTQDHVLLMVLHHIAADGWSLGPLARDLSLSYTARSHGVTPKFSELAIQYADYALWQREVLGDAADQHSLQGKQLAFWRTALADLPEEISLPADRNRPAVRSYRGGTVPVQMEPALHRNLLNLARSHGSSLFMVLQAGLAALLARLGAGEDIPIATAVAGRGERGIEEMVGLFVNTLVLRTDVSGNPTFADLVKRVRSFNLEAYGNQDLPFERLVQDLQPVRSLSRQSLFQVMLILQNAPAPELMLPDLHARLEPVAVSVAKFDLTLTLLEQVDRQGEARGLIGGLEYNADIFERHTVETMVARLVRLLENAVTKPEAPLHKLEILGTAERKQLLEGCQPSPQLFPKELLPEVFENQAKILSGTAAVVIGKESLNYFELNVRANRLAHYLIETGIGPASIVGIYLERSFEMVVALLAVLKAGGAYLPLDLEHPTSRVTDMLMDALPAVVLSTVRLAGRLPHAKAIALDGADLQRQVERCPSENPNNGQRKLPLLASHPAYLIYTSGSTGRPKGVMVEHGSLTNFFFAMNGCIHLGPGDRHVAITTIGFDISILELFLPLCHGATVVLASGTDAHDPEKLVALIRDSRATSMQATPSHWELLLQADPSCLAHLRIFSGGEALSRDLAARLAKAGAREVMNLYGPTEATIWTSTHVVTASDFAEQASAIVNIGTPLVNYRMLVLDSGLEPVPVGVAGELYISGSGLARAYWKRPSLTGERFVADPWSAIPGKRMYRTGDLVRRRKDGRLDFLGRVDQQVKIKGFRIEPGEIEAALGQCEGIRNAVVIVRDGHAGEKQLVAYVVPENGGGIDVSHFRNILAERLPLYMLPATFVALAELPLLPNGKLDRKRLPSPRPSAEGYRSPRTPQEEILCEIFAQILAVERLGIDDSFFVLGGHSLMATRLISRVRGTLGVELALRTLFESPTVAELSPRLHPGNSLRIPLVRHVRPDRLPLSYAQQRLWFIDQLEQTSSEYNISEVWRLRGPLNREALERAVNTIVERHESLRTHFAANDDGPAQVILPDLHIALPLEDLSALDDAQKRAFALMTVSREREFPFDLSQGPLLRMKLLKLGEQDHILLRTVHHIVFDGWSQAVFNRELKILYEAFCQGQGNPLGPLPVQYADFALWQREWLDRKTLGEELNYWKQQLEGAPQFLELPQDRVRPVLQTFSGDMCIFSVPATQLMALKELAQSNQATLYMLLLSVFAILLERYTGQQDLLVGSPIANRQETQLEQLIGVFINSLVMRVRIQKDQVFRELLAAVRSTALDAYLHQDLPFEYLVDALSPRRNLNVPPLYQVMFALQNAPDSKQELRDLSVEALGGEGLRVRFDLEVHAWEGEGKIDFFWIYNRDLFDHWRIEQIVRHYARLLEQVTSASEMQLGKIPMLTGAEQMQLLEEWNQTSAEFPQDKCLHELFEMKAAETPENIAIQYDGQKISYAALNARANALAHYLVSLGNCPESVVGICLRPSAEMVISVLAVLKAGAAYLPLDPEYPRERLAYMLSDAAVTVVLSMKGLVDRLVPEAKALLLDDPALQTRLNCVSDRNPTDAERGTAVFPQHPVYVIYTSGSSGKPKAVVGTHCAMLNRLAWMWRVFPYAADEVTCQKTSLSFVDSAAEIFSPLLQGVPCIILGSDDVKDIGKFVATLETHKISRLVLVPSLLWQLATSDWEIGSRLNSLRMIVSSGEALSADLADMVVKAVPHAKLLNFYGSSELAADSTWADMSTKSSGQPVHIGRPIDNTQVYVLDAMLEPAPLGVTGELYIAGAGLARGYLGRSAMTAEKFVSNPFGSPGTRMYRTGDLARWNQNGMLEYIGRADQQIKVRGYRIELGEIEVALRDCPKIAQAVVAVREQGETGRQLVAYVVAVNGTTPDATAIRRELSTRLPEYMVPGLFVVLESLPMLPNGKIDRKRLPEPQPTVQIHREPQTEQEKILCGLFADVLGLQQAGMDDNFFALGGHSLMATSLVSRIWSRMAIRIPVRAIFEAPTVAQLAKHSAFAKSPVAEKYANPSAIKRK
jgi:amino acid adenylation domain-containing protein/non-ribosomal peptide synthase protein (TIGR01720 family)